MWLNDTPKGLTHLVCGSMGCYQQLVISTASHLVAFVEDHGLGDMACDSFIEVLLTEHTERGCQASF